MVRFLRSRRGLALIFEWVRKNREGTRTILKGGKILAKNGRKVGEGASKNKVRNQAFLLKACELSHSHKGGFQIKFGLGIRSLVH